ncbi:MAG TPA: SDR family oxidoreductase [Vicinamibacterales bacterium]|nr:SDR family oxidoreductase [Vicinamibacterales bacterium]
MPIALHSKVAIVTGGSRGIGLAVAQQMLAAGASVAISGLNQQNLDEASRTLARSVGGEGRVLSLRADVRDPADAERLVTRTVERFGGLDVLVNNAGIGLFAPVADMSVEDWRRVIDTNLSGVFYCTRAAIPHLRRRGGGWIINISSLAGRNAFQEGAAYCASKSALNAFSEALMQEVRHDNIRVSYVMPGSVRTRFSSGGDQPGTEWKLAPDDVAQVVLDLLAHPGRSLPSRVELRPSKPPRK